MVFKTTTTAIILWMVLAAVATKKQSLSVHATEASNKISRTVVKDRIEFVGPYVFEEWISIGDDDFVDIAPNQPSHYHFHYQRIITPDVNNNRRNRRKYAHCDEKGSKKAKGSHDYSDCPPTPEIPPTSMPQSSPEPSAPAPATPELPLPSSSPSIGTLLASESPTMATTVAPTTSIIPLVSPSILPSLPPSSYRPTVVTSVSSTNTPFTTMPTPNRLAPDRNVNLFDNNMNQTDNGDSRDDVRNEYFHEQKNRVGTDSSSVKDGIGSNSNNSGNTGWILGGAAVIFITAFFGGLATRNICSKKSRKQRKVKTKNQTKKRNDPEVATGDVDNNSTKDWESDSVQFSVEESVDSYHIEDCDNWSVSVMSWSPNRNANPESIEIGLSMRGMPNGDDDNKATPAVARPDEIEIEFIDDLEGYGNILEEYGHEEEDDEDEDEEEDSPRPLFSVVDLSGERMASF